MRFITSRVAVAGAVLLALAAGCATGPAGMSSGRKVQAAANVAGLPGIYLGAGAGPWQGPSVRPTSLFLGADWTIQHLRWASWSQRRADGHGFYDACAGPAGGPPCDRFRAAIAATDVRQHDGRRYFAVMKVTGSRGQVLWLVMNTTLGWWQQRARP